MASGRIGLAALGVFAATALGAPILFPDDPLSIVARPLIFPFTDSAVPLGSDRLGRNVLAILVHGARTTLLIALAAAGAALAIGASIGVVAGYFGGWIDEILMRITEAFQTVPAFILALALTSVMGASVESAILAVAAGSWTAPARLARAEASSLRRRDFIDAYRAMGAHPASIVFREVSPNALPPVLALGAVVVSGAILIEAALSFLGLGDPNRASWGAMIAEGRAVLRTAPWLSAIPGLAILSVVLAVNLAGDALIEALAPRKADIY